MITESSRHVVFVYVGNLGTRGRLLKQVATLQSAGVRCEVVHGNSQSETVDPDAYSFPVHNIPFDASRGKIRSFIELFRFARAAASVIGKIGPDTVVCVALASLLAGVRAKRLNRDLRLVFDNNELQIESIDEPLKRMIWRPIHNNAIRHCDVIFHAEANRLKYFQEHYPLEATKQLVIENFPRFTGPVASRNRDDGDVRVIYLGGFGSGRFTDEVIEAFLSYDRTTRLDVVGFGFKGYAERLAERIEVAGRENVRILPLVPYEGIPELLRNYDIGLALYRNTNLNNYYCAPNKVYDYLMNGMPVITNNYPGLLDVIEKNRVGACIGEVNAEEIRSAITQIVDGRMRENITPDLRRRYSWEKQEERYLAMFGH
jgi:glycosyltransferase involved in cell wall biosynthesis